MENFHVHKGIWCILLFWIPAWYMFFGRQKFLDFLFALQRNLTNHWWFSLGIDRYLIIWMGCSFFHDHRGYSWKRWWTWWRGFHRRHSSYFSEFFIHHNFPKFPKSFGFFSKINKGQWCRILPKIREALFCGDQLTRRRWRRCLLREHSSDQKVIRKPKSAQSSTKAKGHRNQAVTIPIRIVYGIFGLFNGQHTFFQ